MTHKKEELSDAEFAAVYNWFSTNKDGLEIDLKNGMRKLISREEWRRLPPEVAGLLLIRAMDDAMAERGL